MIINFYFSFVGMNDNKFSFFSVLIFIVGIIFHVTSFSIFQVAETATDLSVPLKSLRPSI